jgi:DNA repair protein SbcC/Rad50
MTSDRILSGLDVTNFRSIRGHVYAPLDARVVLVHGENGAGKTSLLSAIEYGLTGNIQALHRADPDYADHLLHRSANNGSIKIRTVQEGEEESFEAHIDSRGARSISRLSIKEAAFFTERAYLPQSLLSQLLQIYQESGSDADSPLAKFVGDLLGLDRLDALEAGLKPLHDVRNLRKEVEQWSQMEYERDRTTRNVNDRKASLASVSGMLEKATKDLEVICRSLGLTAAVNVGSVEVISQTLRSEDDERLYQVVLDRQRRLNSIEREIASALQSSNLPASTVEVDSVAASNAYAAWELANGETIAKLQSRISTLLPSIKMPRDRFEFAEEAMPLLESEYLQLIDRAEQGRQDLRRTVEIEKELDSIRAQVNIIDSEIGQISSDSEVLASALGELSSYIKTDVCPVCDRDFAELGSESLSSHVHRKISNLSASAARLITLGKARGESQQTVSSLEVELRTISSRKATSEVVADLDRRSASIGSAIAELQRLIPVLAEGASLRRTDVDFRKRASEIESSNSALIAARETVSEFATAIGAETPDADEGFQSALDRLAKFLNEEAERLNKRLNWRRQGLEIIGSIGSNVTRKGEIERLIAEESTQVKRAERLLERAQHLREQALTVRDTVDGVRSAIIRSVFNNQLNRVWRDLFVRLAPSEPFVPAFRIPEGDTKAIQPKLITVHRDTGNPAGTPGAMLSAGNLNTAALTLFIALHLSVPKTLPWLILDDPVQSMDDVHIAHFAALLRTLSKETDRQVVIAVHDRQLFEYLKLELSPAFPEDSLVTLELVRGPSRDTSCIPNRPPFREEKEQLAIA